MPALPPRPKRIGYSDGCESCDRRKTEGAIACADHRTAAEWAWFADVETISGMRLSYPEPTLF